MKRSVFIGIIGVALCFAHAPTRAADDPSLARLGCPGYETLLSRAREQLTRGDRTSALVSLKRARAVLNDCRQQSEGEIAVATLDVRGLMEGHAPSCPAG